MDENRSKTVTAREHAKHISEGKEEPHHIGKKTVSMLQQEFFSLVNTKEGFRDEGHRSLYPDLLL